jgi:hypothetical protein
MINFHQHFPFTLNTWIMKYNKMHFYQSIAPLFFMEQPAVKLLGNIRG